MFRRSNSSSNIPLLKVNLFGSKETRAGNRRSQSVSRLSERDSVASISQPRLSRKSSLDRKSNANVGSSRTTKTGRAGSLQRTTPTSALSQRTSKISITPSSCYKDRKTIQKLANDKKWVAEQFAKVQDFILHSSLFDHSKVNVNNLKPPTINIFIYITAVLFKEISPKIKITNENYKEVVPAQLKVLQYPGTLSNSVLKTVNTIYSWPQVIGMWSWLIDMVNIAKSTENESFIENLESDVRQKYLLKKNCCEFLVRRYSIFNGNADNGEEIQKVNDTYVNSLAEILGVDFGDYKRLETEMREKQEIREKQRAEIERINIEKMKMVTEIEEMNKEINDFNEMDAIEERDLAQELEILQINLKDLRDRKAVVKTNVTELEGAIKVQPCTYQEKQTLLRQIDQLKNEIQVKRGKIELAQKIKAKFDRTLANEISKIQATVIQWNRSLMELSIKKPELKKLLLREKGFQNPKFLTEIETVLNYKIAIEQEVSNALARIDDELKIQEEKKQELEKDIKELNVILGNINQESLILTEKIDETKRKIKDLLVDLEERRKNHDQQMIELTENADLEEYSTKISELKTKKDNLDLEVKKFSQKMLSFLIELHNLIMNNLKEMDGIQRNVTRNFEDRASNVLENQEQLIEVIKYFNDKTE